MAIPDRIVSGSDFEFSLPLANQPPPDWVLVCVLSGPANYSVTGTSEGSEHVIRADAQTTAGWLVGDYELNIFARNESTSEVVHVYRGEITVLPNVLAEQPATKSHAQKMLELIESVMLGRARHDMSETDIEGARVRRLSPSELRAEWSYWKHVREMELDLERARLGLPPRRLLHGQFRIA